MEKTPITLEKASKNLYNIQENYKKTKGKNKDKIERYNMSAKDRNVWILLIFIFSGLVRGGLLGQVAANVAALSWLSYGESFGLPHPVELDLNVITITFGFMLKINIASILGILIAIFAYKKIG